MLTRQRHVLHRIGRDEGFPITFAQLPDEEGGFLRMWEMPLEDWEDCGRPAVITITMEPRDVLNEDA